MWKTGAKPLAARDSHPQGDVETFSVFHREFAAVLERTLFHTGFFTFHRGCGKIFVS